MYVHYEFTDSLFISRLLLLSQEELLVSHGLLDVSTGADFLHAMAYDASGDAAGK